MASTSVEWEQRVSELWDSLDEHGEDEFLARMEELIAELPENSARAAFERASAFDSTGHADKAVPRTGRRWSSGSSRRFAAAP